jgi:carbon-monoxide dehydrogenase small subunit
MIQMSLTLTINGEHYETHAEPDTSLLDVLRDNFGLTGTKTNCLEAECGVCTVLLDDKAVCSCLTLAAQCQGKSITTIEGLAEGSDLHPLQSAFLETGAVQCGYCIPGMIMTAAAFLREVPNPTESEIREGLAGTLCRCTGYQKIVEAVATAAKQLSQDSRHLLRS